ncbi:MAG TPA: SH3 domain-containing protein [Vicinamibacterales bacterium]|nr:SH3 domain-containing protein [Vicinamibacterales bacterium]
MNKVVITALASSLLLFTSSTAGAQTARARIADTPIRAEANLVSPIIATLKEGGAVDVVDVQGDWYRVLVPNEQGKARVGYVLAHFIDVVNADGSPQSLAAPAGGHAARRIPPTPAKPPQERDQSTESIRAMKAEVDAFKAESRGAPAESSGVQAESNGVQAEFKAVQDDQPILRPRRPAPVPAAAISMTKTEWTTTPFKRVWIDVNFGMAMSAANVTVFATDDFLNQAVAYGKPTRGAEFDFGGGFMFTPLLGLGGSFSGVAHRDIAVVANTFSTDTTGELSRTEGAVNIQAMVVPLNSERLRARVFGGPSLFTYQADMVGLFRTSVPTSGTGLGFHIGGDVTYFFSRVVGIGGFARYSRATASIDEPLSGVKQNITLGGFQTGGGLRFRF